MNEIIPAGNRPLLHALCVPFFLREEEPEA